jgi:hypothetical protein
MNPLHFQSVRVDRFLGIGLTADPVELRELAPGLNVVWAPNGRGKTCTARAIIGLLWANVADPYRVTASAMVTTGDTSGHRELGGGNAQPLAGLPPAELADLYRMSLPELLEARDEDLVKRIRRELHGNIDLGAAATALDFRRDMPTTAISEYKTAAQRLKDLQDVVRKQEEVQEASRLLGALRHKKEALQEEQRLERCYEHLIKRYEASKVVEDAERELCAFPEGMDRLRSADADELLGLLRGVHSLDASIVEAGKDREEAATALDVAGFGADGPPDPVWRETAKGLLDDLREARGKRDTCREKLAGALAHAEEAEALRVEAESVLAQAGEPFLQVPRIEEVAPLEEALQEWRRAREELGESETRAAGVEARIRNLRTQAGAMLSEEELESWLTNDAPIVDTSEALPLVIDTGVAERRVTEWQRQVTTRKSELDRITPQAEQSAQAIALLRQWLTRATDAPPETRLPWGPLFAALGLAATFATLLAVFVSPWWFAALLLPAGLGLWLRYHGRGAGGSQAGATAADFSRSGLSPEPESWTVHHVTTCLAKHESFRAQQKALESWCEQCRTLADAAEADQQRLLARQRGLGQALREKMGLRPESWDAAGLTQLLGLLHDFRTAHRENTELSGKCDHIRQARDERVCSLTERLKMFYPEPAADLSGATEQVTRLRQAADVLVRRREEFRSAASTAARAERDSAAAKRALDGATLTFDECLRVLQTRLSGWYPAPSQLSEVSAIDPVIRDLVKRADAYDGHAAAVSRLGKSIADDETQRGEQAGNVDAWLTARSLPRGREHWEESLTELRKRLDRLPEYTGIRETKQEAEHGARAAEDALSAMECPEEVADLSPAVLRERLEAAPRRSEDLERCTDRIKTIEADIRIIQEGNTLELAAAAREEALLALSRRRDQARSANIGELLCEALGTRSDPGASLALDNARRLFAAFTRNRYQLELPAGSADGLGAFDTERSRYLPLSHLSSGTRVQLLLAARLGFLSAQEQHCRPPVILDEALAVSDDERSTAIMDAVTELVKEGRQVFYFTAQTEEVDRWQMHMQGDLCLRTIGDRPAARESSVPRWRPPEDPAPETGEGIADYGARLGIPALQPWDEGGASAAHPWHVVEDPGLLYRCLRIAGESCGACRAFYNRIGSAAAAEKLACSAAELDAMERRISILDRCLQLWRTGRPRPLGPEDLEEIRHLPRFGETTFAGIVRLYREHRGDVDAVLTAARSLPRFGSAKEESLRRYLEEKGFLGGGQRYTGVDVARLLRREFGDTDDINRVMERSGLFAEG